MNIQISFISRKSSLCVATTQTQCSVSLGVLKLRKTYFNHVVYYLFWQLGVLSNIVFIQHNEAFFAPAELCLYKPSDIVFLTLCVSCAALPWLSGRKTVSACQREVSLVLSISCGVDKKTDGTGEVRGPCYGWQVCLFGLSLISCFPPLQVLADSAYSVTWKWPRRDGSRPLFTRESTLPDPLSTQANSKHMGQVRPYYPPLTRITIDQFVLA